MPPTPIVIPKTTSASGRRHCFRVDSLKGAWESQFPIYSRKKNSVLFPCFSVLKIDFKKRPKIDKKWFLGGSWGCPGTFREPPGSRSARFLRHGGDFGRIWSVPGTSRSPFGDPAGPSRDPKIDPKRLFGQKDGLGERHRKCFSSILHAVAVLDRILLKKTTNFDDFWIRLLIAKNANP